MILSHSKFIKLNDLYLSKKSSYILLWKIFEEDKEFKPIIWFVTNSSPLEGDKITKN